MGERFRGNVGVGVPLQYLDCAERQKSPSQPDMASGTSGSVRISNTGSAGDQKEKDYQCTSRKFWKAN